MTERIIAYAAKSIVKISGIKVQGIRPAQLEREVARRTGWPVRVIGVSGDELKLDVYGLEPEAVLADEAGIIKALALVPGLTGSEVAQIASAEKAVEVSAEELAKRPPAACQRERWVVRDGEDSDYSNRG